MHSALLASPLTPASSSSPLRRLLAWFSAPGPTLDADLFALVLDVVHPAASPDEWPPSIIAEGAPNMWQRWLLASSFAQTCREAQVSMTALRAHDKVVVFGTVYDDQGNHRHPRRPFAPPVEAFNALVRDCPNCEVLDLLAVDIAPLTSGLNALRLPNLTTLFLSIPLWTASSLEEETGRFGQTSESKRLAVESALLCALGASRNLRTLRLDGGMSAHGDLLACGLAAACPRLEVLSLEYTSFCDEDLEVLADGCPELRVFEVHSAEIGDQGLTALARLKQLRTLNLGFEVALDATPAAFGSLARGCPLLSALDAGGFDPQSSSELPNDDMLLELAGHCRSLTSLWVPESRSRITDTGVVAIARANPSLTSLNLGSTSYPAWPGDGADITDASLRALARHCPKLKTLNVRACEQISEEAIAALEASCAGGLRVEYPDEGVDSDYP